MRLYNRRMQKVMEENYVEWLVKRKDPVYAWPVKVLMIVLCALSAFAALQVMFGVSLLGLAFSPKYWDRWLCIISRFPVLY